MSVYCRLYFQWILNSNNLYFLSSYFYLLTYCHNDSFYTQTFMLILGILILLCFTLLFFDQIKLIIDELIKEGSINIVFMIWNRLENRGEYGNLDIEVTLTIIFVKGEEKDEF
ncbi:hypothetical protein SAMN02745191_0186 [Anaerorhabdus furcosa]|uniref:Uncharacterized protein n=1 Tax=Anaerorhabdus furcosa TaxID=118967 RepID=A0A1T4JZ32_9FIRM|nr:hypothetical protein SAMN02745191_0186 [Anaerorhabdus furcosa]